MTLVHPSRAQYLTAEWINGKKRTCPGCATIFLTRKDKRIHIKMHALPNNGIRRRYSCVEEPQASKG